MSAPADAPELAPLKDAFEGGHFLDVLEHGRRRLDDGLAAELVLPVRGWMAHAAFRLGRFAEAIDSASATIEHLGSATSHPARFDALALLVVSHAERAEYDESIDALRRLLAQAARGDSLRDQVRARGSMASCFALMGDPWAAQRVLAEVAGWLARLPGEQRLEATVQVNLAAIWLEIARGAGEGGDTAALNAAAAAAEAPLARSREIAATLGDARIAAFADVHGCEALLLSGQTERVQAIVRDALGRAEGAGLSAHGRFLRLLQAEALLRGGAPEAALRTLRTADARLGPGEDFASRIRQLHLLHAACAALGDFAQALVHMEQAQALERVRQWRRDAAASRHLRLRLELEHLYRPPATLPS
jgi:tetratricopeptide (TPR) repeat protein